MLKKDIKAAISRYDYVLKPALKKRQIPAKDSPFYSMPAKPVVEVPVVPRSGDTLEDVVDTAGIARLNAICDPAVRDLVILKIHAMAKVRNQIGFAQVHGLILAVRNARRAPKVKADDYHRYTDEEKKLVSVIKQAQIYDFEKKLVANHERYSKQSRLKKSSESEVFFGRRGFETRGIVDGEDGAAVRYSRAVAYHVDTQRGKAIIKAGTVREESELKPQCAEYTILWIETPLTAMRVKYTGKRVAPDNFGFAGWYDDYKFGAKDVGEFFQGY